MWWLRKFEALLLTFVMLMLALHVARRMHRTWG